MSFNSIIQRLWSDRHFLRSFPYTIYFNFHYLPFNQAIHLPIWLYKPEILVCKGTIVINGKVTPGMIRMGSRAVSIYPNNGITLELRGKMIFNGSANIGNNSAISTGEHSILSFGKQFDATTSLKIVSYKGIEFGDYCTIGWDCMIMDTDMHSVTKIDGTKSKGYAEIKLGRNNWIANNCKIMKGVQTPDCIVVAANTVLVKTGVDIPQHSIIGNKINVNILAQGWLNLENHIIDYIN